MKQLISACLLTTASMSAMAYGEIGRWSSEWGQGVSVYLAVVSKGSNLEIACSADRPVSMTLTVDGKQYGSSEDQEFDLVIDGNLVRKPYKTDSKVQASNFVSTWSALRKAKTIQAKTSDGKTLNIPTKGIAKELPNSSSKGFDCTTELPGIAVAGTEIIVPRASTAVPLDEWSDVESPASDAAALEEGKTALKKGDFAAALAKFRPLANQGNAEAQAELGRMHANGTGVPQDFNEGNRWYRMAAAKGSALAQNGLGVSYANGEGVPKNDDEAVRWFRMAAAQGFTDALLNLGKCYANGVGVIKDEIQGARLVQRSADQGLASGQHFLGILYLTGKGVPKDATEAVRWFRAAADQGLDLAQYSLGLQYIEGSGLPKDATEAARWFRAAADQGLDLAQYFLGLQYFEGNGLPKDDKEAAKWIRRAADHGYGDAQSELGNLYEKGIGVPKNIKEAVKWYQLAADQGNDYAKKQLAVIMEGEATAALAAKLRSGKIKPTNIQQAMIAFSAADGTDLASAPKIRPDGKFYGMYGVIESAGRGPEFTAHGSRGPGMDAFANFMGIRTVELMAGQRSIETKNFKVVIPKNLQAVYFDKAKIGAGFDLVGRYVDNYSYQSIAGPVSLPVFEAVYFVMWNK